MYLTISQHQVLDSVKSEKEQYGPPPPPVPSRNVIFLLQKYRINFISIVIGTKIL